MYGPVRTPSGAVLQSGVPKTIQRSGVRKANGLLLRGVVVTTYVVDDPDHPDIDFDSQAAVYCDCIVITNIPGSRWLTLRKVLVSQDRGGIHDGRVWRPKAATKDITTNAMNMDKVTNPANLDGDHVMIGFLNDSLSEPVILKGLNHPVADTGQEDEDAGHRLNLKVADGDPDFWKHKGAYYGISDDGDFVADLTQAYSDNDLEADGHQPTPPDDGTAGNYRVKAQKNAEVVLEVDSGKKIHVKSGEVALGEENPIQKVLLGTIYRTAQTTLNSALQIGWTALATGWTAAGVGFTAVGTFGGVVGGDATMAVHPLTKAAGTALAAAAGTAATACVAAAAVCTTTATAIGTFKSTAATNQDFQSNTVKTAL